MEEHEEVYNELKKILEMRNRKPEKTLGMSDLVSLFARVWYSAFSLYYACVDFGKSVLRTSQESDLENLWTPNL